jgi:hypothetical protein
MIPGYPIIEVNGETTSEECICYADGDVNDDGAVLSVADLTYLITYLSGAEIPLPEPYKADLNGDCMVDALDAILFDSFFVYGIGIFVPYGGFPVPTCCNPELVFGACCVTNTCFPLHPYNCEGAGGEYLGDYVFCTPDPCDTCAGQYPGDVNNDSLLNVNDMVYLVDWLYSIGPPPPIMANADPNGDCIIDSSDIDYIGRHLFEGGPPPVECTCVNPLLCDCIPGDANGDGNVDVADGVYLVNFVFRNGPWPTPYEDCSGDANCDCTPSVGDAVYIISYVFKGGPLPCTCADWVSACGPPR